MKLKPKHYRLARMIAYKYPAHNAEDLMQEGLLSLIERMDEYDPDVASFDTYVWNRLRTSISTRSRQRKYLDFYDVSDIDFSVVHVDGNKTDEFGKDTQPRKMLGRPYTHVANTSTKKPVQASYEDLVLAQGQTKLFELARRETPLTKRERQVLDLHLDDELNTREIGDRLGCSHQNADQLIRSSTKKMRTWLEENGYETYE